MSSADTINARNIVLNPYELARVQSTIDGPAAAVSRQRAVQSEKQRLHKQSMEIVSRWDNTIAGQRKRRLAAEEEKNKILEEQRQQVDEEWRQIREAERAEAIERARLMQYVEDSRVRQINSQALVTQVLKEREAQIKFKSASMEAARQEATKEARAVYPKLQEEETASRNVSANQRTRRMELAAVNCEESHRRQKAAADEAQEMRQWAAREHEMALRELKEMEHKKTEKKAVLSLDLAHHLHTMAATKKEYEERLAKEEADRLKAATNLNKIKDNVARRRAEVEKQTIRTREVRNTAAADVLEPLIQYKEDVRTDFLNRFEAQKDDVEKRKAKEVELRRAQLVDCVRVAAEMSLSKQESKRRDVLDNLQVRQQNEAVAQQARLSAQEHKQRDRNARSILDEDYKKQMKGHSDINKHAREEKIQEHVAAITAMHNDDLAFRNYGTRLINNLQSRGNDVTLVERKMHELVLSPSQSNHTATLGVSTDTGVDTFDRLGFKYT